MVKKKYSIQISNDGVSWTQKGGFEEGQASRWGDPMDPETMLKEAQGYRAHMVKYKHVRVIIEL